MLIQHQFTPLPKESKYQRFVASLRKYHPQFVENLEKYQFTAYHITLYAKYSTLPATWRNQAKYTLLNALDLDTPAQSSAE